VIPISPTRSRIARRRPALGMRRAQLWIVDYLVPGAVAFERSTPQGRGAARCRMRPSKFRAPAIWFAFFDQRAGMSKDPLLSDASALRVQSDHGSTFDDAKRRDELRTFGAMRIARARIVSEVTSSVQTRNT